MQTSLFKNILRAALVLLVFALGLLAARWFYKKTEAVEREKATVLLERIQEVAKLVTVEGYFSEIYDYKDYYGYDFGIFRKKALIRVKAKVSFGFDLEKMKIQTLPEQKTILISGIPDPELLSIDHDLDYYDIQEGIFNSFTTEDYTRLNANAKQFIKDKAMESDLFGKAIEQRDHLFEMMKLIVESAGWKLELEGRQGGGIQ
ncbi:MAG: DUF4230 domain-containing protein [Lewinellaceae bacterium]|nr:DUF4230 domain-containing protein [Saprospiraceae bacterium]MCB9340232.1 DUF4230 domain-containing protein [Lewinellaceae bacterium]